MNQEGFLSVRSILEGCIERERMSAGLYKKAQDIVKVENSIELLKKLRAEEIRHEKLLREAMESGRPEVLGNKPLSDVHVPLKNIPDIELNEKSRPKDVLLFAIKHEERAVDYYARYVDAFRGTETGELFERLRKEEESHREKLERVLQKYS